MIKCRLSTLHAQHISPNRLEATLAMGATSNVLERETTIL